MMFLTSSPGAEKNIMIAEWSKRQMLREEPVIQ
jgi:hypothetical protein